MVSSAKKYCQTNWRSSHLVKNLKTFLSLSRNYFWDGTLPPPSFFSKNSRSSGSFFGGIGLHETTKLSSGAPWAGACSTPQFYIEKRIELVSSYGKSNLNFHVLLIKIKHRQKWWLLTYNKEFSGVLITIVDSNGSSTDADIKSDLEVQWLEWHIWTVLLNDYLSLQETALWSSWVDLFWLTNQDWSIFEEIVNNEFSNSIVFKSWLYNWFFEISEKAEHLYIKSKY